MDEIYDILDDLGLNVVHRDDLGRVNNAQAIAVNAFKASFYIVLAAYEARLNAQSVHARWHSANVWAAAQKTSSG